MNAKNSTTVVLAVALFVCMRGPAFAFQDDSIRLVATQSENAPTAQAAPNHPSTAVHEKTDSTNKLNSEEAIAFVQLHQPALIQLLEYLEKKQPTQYQQAIREILKTRQKLANLEKRDRELHEVELALWKLRAELRLLVARRSIVNEQERNALDAQLHKLVEQEMHHDLERMRIEKRRAEQRIAQLDIQIAERNANREAAHAKAVKTWINRSSKPNPKAAKARQND